MNNDTRDRVEALVASMGGTVTTHLFDDGFRVRVYLPGMVPSVYTEYWGDKENAWERAERDLDAEAARIAKEAYA